MDCASVKKSLSAYLDKELSNSETRGITEHLRLCQSCTDELIGLRKVTGLLQSLSQVKAPERLAVNVRQELAVSKPPAPAVRSHFFFRYRWAIGSLTAAAAVLLVLYTNMTYFSKQPITLPAAQPPSSSPLIKETKNSKEPPTKLVKEELTGGYDSVLKEKTDPFKPKTSTEYQTPPVRPEETKMTPPLLPQSAKERNLKLEIKKTDAPSPEKDREFDKAQISGRIQRESAPAGRTEIKTTEPKGNDAGNSPAADKTATDVFSQTIQITCSDMLACETQVNRIINNLSEAKNQEGLNDTAGNRGRTNEKDGLAQPVPGSPPSAVESEELKPKNESAVLPDAQKKLPKDEKKTVQLRFRVPLEQKEQIVAQLKKLGQVKIDEGVLAEPEKTDDELAAGEKQDGLKDESRGIILGKESEKTKELPDRLNDADEKGAAGETMVELIIILEQK